MISFCWSTIISDIAFYLAIKSFNTCFILIVDLSTIGQAISAAQTPDTEIDVTEPTLLNPLLLDSSQLDKWNESDCEIHFGDHGNIKAI